MKTNHSITTLLLLLSLGMTSCSTYYRMTSRIDTIERSMHEVIPLSLQEIRHITHFCFNWIPTGR